MTLIFWGGLFGAIQLQDRRDSDFPDPLLGVRLRELTIAEIQDIEEKSSSSAGLSRDASSVRASQLDDSTTRSH